MHFPTLPNNQEDREVYLRELALVALSMPFTMLVTMPGRRS